MIKFRNAVYRNGRRSCIGIQTFDPQLDSVIIGHIHAADLHAIFDFDLIAAGKIQRSPASQSVGFVKTGIGGHKGPRADLLGSVVSVADVGRGPGTHHRRCAGNIVPAAAVAVVFQLEGLVGCADAGSFLDHKSHPEIFIHLLGPIGVGGILPCGGGLVAVVVAAPETGLGKGWNRIVNRDLDKIDS